VKKGSADRPASGAEIEMRYKWHKQAITPGQSARFAGICPGESIESSPRGDASLGANAAQVPV